MKRDMRRRGNGRRVQIELDREVSFSPLRPGPTRTPRSLVAWKFVKPSNLNLSGTALALVETLSTALS